MSPIRALFIAIVLQMAQVSAQPSARLTIAVNDLKGTGIDPAAVTIISDRLRSELINTGAFRVMERAEMESILKEQGFQQSGACDESSCIIQVGQLLGVNRMVAGSVGAVGTFWTISLRMLNVETGEILFTVNEDYDGDIKGVISTATAEAAAKLAAGAGSEILHAALAGKTGNLFVASSDTGARVEVDGKAVPGVTPLTLKGFAAGDHEIVVRKDAFSGEQKITLKPDAELRLNISMQKDKGSLSARSEPSGASVFLTPTSMSIGSQLARGAPAELGKTPFQSDSVEPGEYWLLYRKKGYSDDFQKINIVSDQVTTASDTVVKLCRFLTFDYGVSSLNAGTFEWKEDGVFDVKYEGIQWKTISHLGMTIAPIRFYSPPKGMNSFMISDEIGISVDQNECSSSQVRRIDKLLTPPGGDTTYVKTTSASFLINRLCADIRMPIGYRWMLKPIALEPYSGFDFRVFNLTHLRGSLVDSSDFWVQPDMRIAFPLGAKIYLYVGQTALVLGFEYNSDITMVKLTDDLDYDQKLGKNITGGFSSENISSFVLSFGATF